jgi:hypothetical protein
MTLGMLFGALFRLQGADLSLSETDLIPKDLQLWDESMLWSDQISVFSGLGYKDNVLLSPFNPHGSAFVVNGLDAVIIRLPLDGWKVEGTISGEDRQYWRDVGTSSEDLFIAGLRLQREWVEGWQAGLELRGLYENRVLDISPQPRVPATVLVRGESFTVQPSLRKDLVSGWWLQLEMPVSRYWLASPLDDYWEFGPVVTAGYDIGKRSEITLNDGVTYQNHNAWVAYADPNGNLPLPQKLEIFQNQTELAWRQYWDAHLRWQTFTHLVFDSLEDNGGGYFNEYQYQVLQDLRWQTADWLIKGSVALSYEDYPVQGVGKLNGQTLYRDLWDLSGEVERRLYKRLKVYAKLEYQRAISNEVLDAQDYHATTVSGGLRWEF